MNRLTWEGTEGPADDLMQLAHHLLEDRKEFEEEHGVSAEALEERNRLELADTVRALKELGYFDLA